MVAEPAALAPPPAAPRQVLGGPPFGGFPQPGLGDPVNAALPRCPNTARSHTSLACSVSGVSSARRACRARQVSQAGRCSRSPCVADGAAVIEATCWRRSVVADQPAAASSVWSCVHCGCAAASPASTWAATSGGRPRRLTCPAAAIAGSAARHAASSRPGTALRPCAQPLLVGVAVAPLGPSPVPRAGRHRARPAAAAAAGSAGRRGTPPATPEHAPRCSRCARHSTGRRAVHRPARQPGTAHGSLPARRGRQQPLARPMLLRGHAHADQPSDSAGRRQARRRGAVVAHPGPGRPAGPAAGARPAGTAPGSPDPSPPRPGTPGRSARDQPRGVAIQLTPANTCVDARPAPPAPRASAARRSPVAPRPAPRGWAPARPPPAAGPGQGAGRPARKTSTRDRAGLRSRRGAARVSQVAAERVPQLMRRHRRPARPAATPRRPAR